MRQIRIIIFFIAVFSIQKTFSAACCGGGTGQTQLILGNEKFIISSGLLSEYQLARASQKGNYTREESSTRSIDYTYQLRGSYLLNDRYQAGLSLIARDKTIRIDGKRNSHFDLSALNFYLGRKFMEQTSYSDWKPRGIFYLEGKVPLGKSQYEGDEMAGLDQTSNGLYGGRFGLIFAKTFKSYDGSLGLNLGHELSRSFNPQGQSSIKISPSWSLGTAAGLGKRFSNIPLRLGINVSWSYQRPSLREFQGQKEETLARQMTTLGLALTYFQTDLLFWILNVYDESLIGPASFTDLDRGIGIQMVYSKLK